MDCLGAFCGHFLYHNLPEILLTNDVILLFTLTKTFVRFAVTSFSSGAADEAAPTNESNFQVNVKRRIKSFGKRILGKL